MATIIPECSDDELDDLASQAEVKVYRALRELPQEYVIFFQIEVMLREEKKQAKDASTDFLVCHPDQGYLCIEVKGGRIGCDEGRWFSTDRHGVKHSIRNPMTQAKDAKHTILAYLKNDQRWCGLPCFGKALLAHAVFFPDMSEDGAEKLGAPDLPAALIGSAKTLQNPKAWIDEVFAFWGNDGNFTPLGPTGIDILREVFAPPSIDASEQVAKQLENEKEVRLELTKQQMRILDFLKSQPRVAVSGGAGTGKTVMAVMKARRLAAEGYRTLLTCYSEKLADNLKRRCEDTKNLEVMHFHGLCLQQNTKAKNDPAGRDLITETKEKYPEWDDLDVRLPYALAESMKILSEDRYDAIVCDEGQDFGEKYWEPLVGMLKDKEHSTLYVFYDDNQSLYKRADSFPIPKENTFLLTKNCRNTRQIHGSAFKYYKGEPVSPPDNEGDDVEFVEEFVESSGLKDQAEEFVAEFVESSGLKDQAEKIHYRVQKYINQDISASDITVLIADDAQTSQCYSALKGYPLPKSAKWLVKNVRTDNTVLIETVRRFKGLESPIVILWGLDTLDLDSIESKKSLYVGMSRAKSILIVVGTPDTCKAIRDYPGGTEQ
jgi:superfamily I DNA/RNA helicase